jgi:hypothetical protein
MATEKIFIGIDNERVELKGSELETFLAERSQMQAETETRQVEADAKAAARKNALAKLSDLGLTAEEIAAL